MRIDPNVEMNPIQTHDFDNLVLLCGRTGLVEPITQSLRIFIQMLPNLAKKSFDKAMLNDNLPYIYRFNTASYYLGDYISDEIMQLRDHIRSHYEKYFSLKLNDFLAGRKMSPNDECYCGSGKKYMKCCRNNRVC